MPSRKRAKGRERKLKQQAREPAVERSVSQPPLSPNNGESINLPEQDIRRIEQEAESVTCDHGCVYTSQEHPVSVFMDSFLKSKKFNVSTKEFMKMAFEKHQEVWKDSTMRKMAIDMMLCIGTNLIIDKDIDCAIMISESIIYLEKYTSESTYDSVFSKVIEDMGYLLCAEDREVVHFYKKRIPCSCLGELYAKIKKCQVRGGRCFHCKQTIKRKDIKTCNGCKFSQYCSKECQISAWPTHKEICMKVANLHERVKKEETARSNEGI